MSKLVDRQEQSLHFYEIANDRPWGVTTLPIRLQQAMDLRGMDQSYLAAAIGVTQGTISLILVGKTRRSKYLPEISRVLAVSYDWLISGRGDRDADARVEELLTPAEHQIIGRLRSLPNHDANAIHRIVSALAATAGDRPVVTLPSEAALESMFAAMIDSVPGVGGDELARELATLLPIALGNVQGPLLELPSAPAAASPARLEDDDDARPARRRA